MIQGFRKLHALLSSGASCSVLYLESDSPGNEVIGQNGRGRTVLRASCRIGSVVVGNDRVPYPLECQNLPLRHHHFLSSNARRFTRSEIETMLNNRSNDLSLVPNTDPQHLRQLKSRIFISGTLN